MAVVAEQAAAGTARQVRESVLEKYAGRAVPRYTSYPTAPHFQAEFPPATYAGWLGALDPAEPVSLYLHVPFCRQMCWYCGCNRQLVARPEPVADYVALLRREIALVAAALPARMRVSHLHWGGGTPTALPPDDLARLMEDVFTHFDCHHDAELALECDPRTLTDAMMARIGDIGFTRASFGVQEFDPKVQEAINRVQPPAMVERAVEGLRAAGVRSVNFDLIYGLPYQRVETLLETIDTCIDMQPDRIALFGYAHVPWMAKNQRMIPEAALPGSSERAAQADGAAERLVEGGYQAIGLDHFALPADELAVAARERRLHRNFQGYTTDTAETLIGLGTTAIGRSHGGFVQNAAATPAWGRAIEAGELPVAKGVSISDDDRLRAGVIEALMCNGQVDTVAAGEAFGLGPDWDAAERGVLAEMQADGLLDIDGAWLRLTEAGLPLSRVAASAYDRYLGGAGARHSIAV